MRAHVSDAEIHAGVWPRAAPAKHRRPFLLRWPWFSSDGSNYLVPVDADIASEDEVGIRMSLSMDFSKR